MSSGRYSLRTTHFCSSPGRPTTKQGVTALRHSKRSRAPCDSTIRVKSISLPIQSSDEIKSLYAGRKVRGLGCLAALTPALASPGRWLLDDSHALFEKYPDQSHPLDPRDDRINRRRAQGDRARPRL